MASTSDGAVRVARPGPETLLPKAHCEAPTSATTTIRLAFEKLEDALHPSDARLFRSTTLEDVRSAAKIIERDQEQRRCLRNLRRIEPLFQGLARFGSAIDILCQGTPYLCFIWAPIKLLLQIADEYTNGFNELIDAYGQIAKHLPRFDRLGSAFSNQVDFQSVLADVYDDILEFHRRSYQILRRSGWKLLFDASWRRFDSRFNAILQNLTRNQDLVDREATSFDILESKACRQKLLEDIEKREAERREWQLRDTLAWLDLKGQDLEQQELFERLSNAREPETCQWILRHPTINLWLDPDDHRLFFWLRGKPGSGKTTLATYLVEETPIPPASQILYCLCSYGFGGSERNPCSLTFRSLCAQILRKRPDLLPYVYDNYAKTGAIPSLVKARELLRNLLQFSERIFLVLDGLDEFEGPDQRQVLQEITNLVTPTRDLDHLNLKVLVCSRETREITRKIGQNAQIFLSDEDQSVSRDIAIFTRNSLSELKDRFPNDEIDVIRDSVVQKANGMFLWVQLVLSTILEQESVQDLRSAVQRLPSGLQGVYKFILNRIRKQTDEQQRVRAQNILNWLAFACRPLKVWEICTGIVFFDDAGIISDESKLNKGILDVCKPLIEVRDGGIVAMVHFSAREFLLHRTSGPYLSPFLSHANITISCVRYLHTCSEFATGDPSPTALGHIIKGFHDIFHYVHEFWPDHLTKCVEWKERRDDKIWESVIDELSQLFTNFSRPSASTDLELSCQLLPSAPTAISKRDFPALPQPVQRYLDFRKTTSMKSPPSRIDTGGEKAENDPTTITETYSYFRAAFESLVNHGLPFSYIDMNINAADLESFTQRHRSAAFCCRWSGCMWASTGFQTLTQRADHETSHKKQFRCSEAACDFATNGFASRAALRKHSLKYHTKEEDLVLPELSLHRAKSTTTFKLGAQNLDDDSLTEAGRGPALAPETNSPSPTKPSLHRQTDHFRDPSSNDTTTQHDIYPSPKRQQAAHNRAFSIMSGRSQAIRCDKSVKRTQGDRPRRKFPPSNSLISQALDEERSLIDGPKRKNDAQQSKRNDQILGDTLSYFAQIKSIYIADSYVYNRFLDIWGDFQASRTDAITTIEKIVPLFKDFPWLIEEFNTFLPPRYVVKVTGREFWDAEVLVTGPGGITVFPLWYHQYFPYDDDDMQQLQTSGGIEYEVAISYVQKIKTRYKNQPGVYRQFIKYLQAYKSKTESAEVVYKEIEGLFSDDTDLIEGIKLFIPSSTDCYGHN